MSGQDATPTQLGEDGQTVSLAAFLESLWRSELLGPQQEKEILARSSSSAGAAAEQQQPRALAAWIVSRGWLTAYQAGLLLSGRGDELTLGDYRLLEPLGEGGMGQVFKARHALMNRVVALKLIRPDFVNDQNALRRFRQEMQAAAQLSHPNVVVAHDAAEVGGRHFLVMEFCEGATLYALVARRGPLPVEAACDYVRQAALGLQHAFERGLTHRDVKPDNLILCGSTIKILDFGLAQLRVRGEAAVGPGTKEGTILGTPDYLAPEQADGRAEPRSDLYSLGCSFYFLLTGDVPFPGGTLIEKCLRHKLDTPEPVERKRPDVPPAVCAVVRRLMAKDPNERFSTPAEVAAALASFSRAGPPPGRGEGNPPPPALADGGGTLGSPPPESRGGTTAHQGAAGRPRTSGVVRWLLAVVGAVAVGVAGVYTYLAMPRPRPIDRREETEKKPPSPRAWRKAKIVDIHEGLLCYGLAFSPDSQLLAVAQGHNEDAAMRDGRVHVWEVAGWRRVADEPSKMPVMSVAFSPDGKTLAWGTGYRNFDVAGDVVLWDVGKRERRNTFAGVHPKGALRLAFQPGGKLLASSGREGKVRLWGGGGGADGGEGEELQDCKAAVYALAFSPDGEVLAVGDDNGKVYLWEVRTKKGPFVLEGTVAKPIRGLAFTPDGDTLIAVTRAGIVKDEEFASLLAWRRPKWQARPAIDLGLPHAFCLALSPDGATFLAGRQDGTGTLGEVGSWKPLQMLEEDDPILWVAFSPDGRHLATGRGGWSKAVQLWEEDRPASAEAATGR